MHFHNGFLHVLISKAFLLFFNLQVFSKAALRRVRLSYGRLILWREKDVQFFSKMLSKNKTSAQFVDGWTIAQVLGEGAFGEVKLLINDETRDALAVKIINTELQAEAGLSIRKEIAIHRALSHPNIIKYFGHRTENCYEYIFLEYASGGELFNKIEPDIGMKLWEAQKYFTQLISGVEYLHVRGISHRDIKPENILLDDNDDVKISDFGLATMFRKNGVERLLDKKCGTMPYVAPEVLLRPYKAIPADIWSCGIVLVAMLAGELPWDAPTSSCKEFVSWKNNVITQSPWNKLDNSVLNLLRKILVPLPEKRLTATQILKHGWCAKALPNESGKSSEFKVGIIRSDDFRITKDLAAAVDSIRFLFRLRQVLSDSELRLGSQSVLMPGKAGRITPKFVPPVPDLPSKFCFGNLVYDYVRIHKARLPKHDLKESCQNGVLRRAIRSNVTPASKRLHSGSHLSPTTALFEESSSRLCFTQPLPAFSDHRDGEEKSAIYQDEAYDHNKIYCFSQPAHIDDLLLSSQLHCTQATTLNSYQKLVRRMTRFFVSTDLETAIARVVEALESLACSWKRGPPFVLTFTTVDRRKNTLIFKASVIEMSGKVLLDFRLSRGCGLEFKKLFIKTKEKLGDLVLKGPVSWSTTADTSAVP